MKYAEYGILLSENKNHSEELIVKVKMGNEKSGLILNNKTTIVNQHAY